MPPREIALDQRYALKTATARLQDQFDGTFGSETVERFLFSSYAQFADRAVARNFLPLLAERFTKQRLQAMTRVNGNLADSKPVVLFVCDRNAGPSQIALGFFKRLAGDNATAWSGGATPDRAVPSAVVSAMAERGVDISREYPKPWTEEIVRAADVVVTMGADTGTQIPGKRYVNWQLEDLDVASQATVRRVRNDIKRRVRALLVELQVEIAPERSAG